MTKPTIFISYSREDEQWKKRLVTHLGVLEHEGSFEVWDDSRIQAGEDWQAEIEAAMDRAALAILLVSAEFLNSDFVRKKEIPHLIDRRKKEGMHIFPIVVKPCSWHGVKWLASLQVQLREGKPLSSGTEHQVDEALSAIADKVHGLLASPSNPGTESPIPKNQTKTEGENHRPELPQVHEKFNPWWRRIFTGAFVIILVILWFVFSNPLDIIQI